MSVIMTCDDSNDDCCVILVNKHYTSYSHTISQLRVTTYSHILGLPPSHSPFLSSCNQSIEARLYICMSIRSSATPLTSTV